MAVIRRGGISGKVCEVCGVWKMLCDFPLDNKPGRFKGYRHNCCKACMDLMKKTNKNK